jgi:hypothetical protein
VLVSPDQRVRLADRFPVTAAPELEAVFVGAAAAQPAFGAASAAVSAAVQLGFKPRACDVSLNNLPLAFSSAAAFDAAFPGDNSWLAHGVHDFFNAGGVRAWVVRVEVVPATPIDSYMRPNPPIVATLPPTGVEIAMQVPSVGLLVLPDLEYLCLASALPPPATLPVAPPAPIGFRPLSDFVAPPRPLIPPPPVTMAAVLPGAVLSRVSTALAAQRPDMLCLFALPIGADQTAAVPALVKRAEAYIHANTAPGPDLPQVQAFAPLIRDATGDIASPSGLIAGVLSATAETDGVWRSITGRALPLGATPLRRIESNALAELRSSGIAVLRFDGSGMVLDDDVLAVNDVPGAAPRRSAGMRRLMGWLLRNLHSFGEQLVFENVLDGGVVELILTDLFAALLERGALNGRQVSDAVSITRNSDINGALVYDIRINAAVALETIQLQFLDGALTTTLKAAA